MPYQILIYRGEVSAECRVQNAECRMQSAECRMQSAECRIVVENRYGGFRHFFKF